MMFCLEAVTLSRKTPEAELGCSKDAEIFIVRDQDGQDYKRAGEVNT